MMSLFIDTIEKVKSGVVRIASVKNNSLIGSGTGFLANDYLITNYHVLEIALKGEKVLITFFDTKKSESITSSKKDLEISAPYIVITQEDLKKLIVRGSEENSYDYAILKIPEQIRYAPLFQFNLIKKKNKMGMDVSFLGYPLDAFNISCHSGKISSLYKSGIIEQVIQIDASVNSGNSGGPLFLPETGEVIGIITRKATGVTMAFDNLRKSIKQNIKELNQPKMMDLGGIDPVEVLKIGQHQMLRLTDEIERSANVGIGYAFPIDPIIKEIEQLEGL